MIPTDPFTALATLAIDLLPWAADKIAGHLLGEGADASASQVKRWANNRETQEQLHAAIEVALAKTRREARFSDFDQLFYPESLARDVVRVALTPHLLAEPDYDEILRRSRQLTADREHARVALEFFFGVFRHQWEEQTAFAALRHDYETTLTHLQVQEIAQTLDVSIEELRAIRQRLEAGVPTVPATARPPDPALVRAYLEEIAAQKPYTLWRDQTYIDRTVARTEDLFARTVARYDPRAPEREGKAKPEPLEAALAREGKVVLLGEPGLGKTTSLVHLAWDAANRALAKPPAGLEPTGGSPEIPIYVELKYYNGEAELETLLARRVNEILVAARKQPLSFDQAESTRRLKAWLVQSEARFLLLLDGLNEVRPEFHTPVRGALQALLNSPHLIVVSCREHDYDESLRDRAAAFVLQGLQENEIRNYLQRVLDNKGVKLFDEEIRRDDKMLTLAANPLVLWLIGVVAQGDPEARLPANRGKLFQQFVEQMPRLRAAEGILVKVPPAIVTTALSKLGFEMQERGQLAVDLEEILNWQIPTTGRPLDYVLAQAKEYRFLKADGRLGEPVEFLHQLFQEYFAAVHLNYEIRDLQFEIALGERPFSSNWNEVIIMLAGISDQPVELVKWLAAQSLDKKQGRTAFLVHRCWETSDAVRSIEACTVVISALTAALHDPDCIVRWYAASALKEIGAPAVELLCTLLRDQDKEVRVDVAGILGRIGNPLAIEPLITALRDPYRDVRCYVALALQDIGAPAVKPLCSALYNSNIVVREGAAAALRAIGTPAVEPLIAVLSDPDAKVHKYAAYALADIRDSSIVEPLIVALRDPDKEVRWWAAHILGEIGDPRTVEPLIATLRDSAEDVRWLAAVALGKIGDQRAVEPLLASLRDPDTLVRRNAAWALGKISDPRAVEPLIATLSDPDADVCRSAADALEKIGDPRALPELERVAREDKGWLVTNAAREAAEKIRQRMSSG